MSTVYKYLIVMIGLMLLLPMMGIETGSSVILGYFGDMVDSPEGLSASQMKVIATAIFTTVAVGAIVVGFYFSSSPESVLLFPYALVLVGFAADMLYTYTSYFRIADAWIKYPAALILIPLTFGYIHAVVSWWGGKQ